MDVMKTIEVAMKIAYNDTSKTRKKEIHKCETTGLSPYS